MESETFVIETNHLEKSYKTDKVVSDLCINVKKGGVYGLIGPNGAGKTTIMKMIAGLVVPTGGELKLFGQSGDEKLADMRKRMSFMIEIPYVKMGLTAYQNLDMQRLQKGIPDKKRIDEVLKLVGLQNCGKKLVKQFSLGMRQRLGIANALMSRPEIMVLDEPVNGLDPSGMVEIRNLIMKLNKEQEITIMISSHILAELSQMCTDYLFVNHGEILESLSAEELHDKCSRYLAVATNDNGVAATIIKKALKTNNFVVHKNGIIKLYDYTENVFAVSKALIEGGLIPTHLCTVGDSLEDYYLSLTGGACIE